MSKSTSFKDTDTTEIFCPICGRPQSPSLPFINGICRDCFLKTRGVAHVPERVNITICNYCGAYKISKQWIEQKPRSLLEAISNALVDVITRRARPVEGVKDAWVEKVESLEPVETYGEYRFKVSIRGIAEGGVALEKDYVVLVRASTGICPSCIKRKVGYHEALIQIRGLGGVLNARERERLIRFLDKLPSRLQEQVVDVEERKEGIDLMITDHATARIIASKISHAFVGKKIETYSLVGRRSDGKRLGKLTISVRIPALASGELISIDGSPYLVTGIERGRLRLLDLSRNIYQMLDAEGFWSKNIERNPYVETGKLMLVSKGRETYVFLDAETSYSKAVEYPIKDVVNLTNQPLVEGKEYKVYKVGRRIYIII
ncbi:MAG: hypothetical protein F7C32_02575 [Desulfurococcales archaeon]|nr:hypothetical protein [Desulfurococcales archaeon]